MVGTEERRREVWGGGWGGGDLWGTTASLTDGASGRLKDELREDHLIRWTSHQGGVVGGSLSPHFSQTSDPLVDVPFLRGERPQRHYGGLQLLEEFPLKYFTDFFFSLLQRNDFFLKKTLVGTVSSFPHGLFMYRNENTIFSVPIEGNAHLDDHGGHLSTLTSW